MLKKILAIPNATKDKNLETTKYIIDYIEKCNNNVYLFKDTANLLNRKDIIISEINSDIKYIDCIVVLGGDGTILSTARKMAVYGIPILGVNLGRLGFLAEVEKNSAQQALTKVFNDNYYIDERMMLETEIVSGGSKIVSLTALNDAVITRGAFSRMIDLHININNSFIDIFTADGIIISTPTGSTAYNLSAGGPILEPSTEMMVITPICPHSLNVRSIVVSSEDEISIKIGSYSHEFKDEIMLTVDGQQGYKLNYDDIVILRKAQHYTKLIKTSDNNFYDILREKMLK